MLVAIAQRIHHPEIGAAIGLIVGLIENRDEVGGRRLFGRGHRRGISLAPARAAPGLTLPRNGHFTRAITHAVTRAHATVRGERAPVTILRADFRNVNRRVATWLAQF